MNCRPGDLAVVVKSQYDQTQIGKIVRVVEWCTWTKGWIVSPPILFYPSVHDEVLRPIRDPGADAVDEVLQRLPVPIIQPKIKEDKSEVAHG